MNLVVKQTLQLAGHATPPSSKSQSVRAVLLASLSHGQSSLHNILQSTDTQTAIQTCQQLGAKIIINDNSLIINSPGLPLITLHKTIHTGNSGITTHFVMPLLGLRHDPEQPIILTCDAQMQARPLQSLITALNDLGMQIRCLAKPDALPIELTGKLRGGCTSVDGTTSQYLSALLFALPCAELDSEINVTNLQERPYVAMTLAWLRKQNIQFEHQSNGVIDTYKIKGRQCYQNFTAKIASDFSSASYLIAAAVMLPGTLTLHGLDMADTQGDKRLISILQTMGADIRGHSHQLVIQGGKPLTGIKIDAGDIPDLLPTLAVIGTYARGRTQIYNAAHARIKETDRIVSMTAGLQHMGADIVAHADGLTIYQSTLCGADVNGYGDHRTVMALSIAGLLATGITTISNGEAIQKTFPSFVDDLRALGANIEMQTHAAA